MNATLEELSGWLKQQRWFGGKGVPISKVEVMERIPLQSAPDAEASIVRVSYVLGTPETYLVLLQRTADGQLRDALEDPGVARAVLDFARDARQVPVGAGVVRAGGRAGVRAGGRGAGTCAFGGVVWAGAFAAVCAWPETATAAKRHAEPRTERDIKRAITSPCFKQIGS